MLVKYLPIKPSSIPGEYEARFESEVMDDTDLLNDCTGEVYELGAENLPSWATDIRGLISNEPDRGFVERNGDRVTYFGFAIAE